MIFGFTLSPLQDWLLSPVVMTGSTVILFYGAQALYHRTRWLLLHPVLVTVGLLIGLLSWSEISFEAYKSGTEVLDLLLGMAVVALGVKMYEHIQQFRLQIFPIAIAILAGGLTGSLSVLLTAQWLGADQILLATLAAKSATTPISIGISAKVGGIVPLTAAITISNGIFGAVFGPLLLNLFQIRDPLARGLAIGTAAHGIGTARMAEEGTLALAAGSLAIALNGLVTALISPWVLEWFG